MLRSESYQSTGPSGGRELHPEHTAERGDEYGPDHRNDQGCRDDREGEFDQQAHHVHEGHVHPDDSHLGEVALAHGNSPVTLSQRVYRARSIAPAGADHKARLGTYRRELRRMHTASLRATYLFCACLTLAPLLAIAG